MPGPHDVDDLDFSDLDLDSTSADFDDGFDGGAEEQPADKPRRKRGKDNDGTGKKGPDVFTLAVYGVVALGIVGAIVWQLGLLGGGQPERTPFTADGTVPAQQQQAFDANGQPIPTDQPGTSDPFAVMGTPSTDAVVDPNAAPQDPGQQAALTEAINDPGQPAAVIPQDQLPPVALPSPDAPVTSVMPAAEANAPDADAVPMPNPVPDAIPPAPAITTEPVPAMPLAAPVASGASSAEVSAIMSRLDAIEKRLDAQASSPTPAVAGEIQQLKDAVEKLQTGSATKAAPVEEAPKKTAAPAKKKKTASTKKKSSTATAKKKDGGEWDQPYNGGSVSEGASAPSAASSASGYTLRAAQPGAAWVSASDGALQEVRVGDTLPGVGEVKAITQNNGRWTVSGSKGRIAQ